MVFDSETGRFIRANGTALPVVATFKRGRWQYRTDSGTLLASGMTPREFVKQFWFADLEDN